MDWELAHGVGPTLRRGANDNVALHDASIATMESGQAPLQYAVYVPENYTSGYAYPLVVWFHEDGVNERDVMEWLPRISPRNYLGIGLRGPLPAAGGIPGQMRWSTGPEHLQWVEDQLAVALLEVCQRLSIHCDRIVTAGIGSGASVALQMLLRRPDVFAGSACLNAALPPDWRLHRWGQSIGRSIWLGHNEFLATTRVGRPAMTAARTFHAAGMNVALCRNADVWRSLEELGRDLDWWLIHTLCGDTVIA